MNSRSSFTNLFGIDAKLGEVFPLGLSRQVTFLKAQKVERVLIGLCGYAGVGKDTAAEVLLEELAFQRIAFADPIKKALLALDPLVPGAKPGEFLRLSEFTQDRDWSEIKEYPEVRRLMQVMGTEVGRNLFDPDIWVRLAERKLESTLSVGDVVVTDVRFPNEARLIRGYGGLLIRIDRPGFGPVNEHLSDRASERWAYESRVDNDGDVESLRKKMRELITELRAENSEVGGEDK